MLKNDKVPAFTVTSTQGNFTDEHLLGRWTILYFYPKDNTPGCTAQAQDFTTYHLHFLHQGAQVVGVSKDSVKSHANFQAKYSLPFVLISDTEEVLCKLFDVIQLKKNFGKEYMGIVRSTFLIDPHGHVAEVWKNVKVDGHVIEVLETFKTLKK